MNTEQLIALRPTERTLHAIADSLERIARARDSTKTRIGELDSGVAELMRTGTASEITAAREELVLKERLLVELAHLEAAVKELETPIRRENAIRQADKLWAEAEEKTHAWVSGFVEQYAPAAAAIALVLKTEQAALAAYGRAVDFQRKNAALLEGVELKPLNSPKMLYPTMKTPSFSGEVKLPGMKGAPHCGEEDTPFWNGSHGTRPELSPEQVELGRRARIISDQQQQIARLEAQLSGPTRLRPVGHSGFVRR